MTGSDGIYQLHWPEFAIKAKVDRLKSNSEHEVKGEVTFTSQNMASQGHLRQSRVNLSSTAAKNALVKSLSERVSSDDVPWDTIVEQLCVAVLREFRQGPPLLTIEGDMDVEAVDKWLIEPILQLGHPTLVYGKGSSGKSWFGQYISVLADAGVSINGLRVEPSRVLYLDWETTDKELGSRVTMIRRGMGLDGKSSIKYREMSQGLYADIETVRNHVQEHEIDLVIMDSLGAACMGEPESAEVVLRMFQCLRSLRVTSLCIDHSNKEGSLFGSVYKFNSGRQIFECLKAQDEDATHLDFGLFHRKASNSKLIRPLGFKIQFNEGSVDISRRDIKDTALESEMTVAERIANALSSGAKSPKELAELLDKQDNHIRQELLKGKQKGRFFELGNGTYGLAFHQQTVEAAWHNEVVI